MLLKGTSHILLSKNQKKKEINYHVLITRVSLDIPTRLQMGKLPERTLKHCRSALHLIRYEHLNESPGEDRTARYFNTQPSQATAANAWAFKTEKIPPPCACFGLFQAMFTLWSPSINSDTSCKCFHCSTESFLSGSNMWYQFIILNNATRNPLTLKIKRVV